MYELWPLLVGGLVLFLYAITKLSETLREIFSDRAKTVIQKFTRNIFVSILIGTIITIILDSSSAVIIITIVFINAHTLSFRNAIGIIMGANIGTTFSSQIIALDVGKYSIIPLIIGLAIKFLTKQKKWDQRGEIFLYFGMLFFGLYVMEEAVAPLKQSDVFKEWIATLDSPVKGALIGGLVTLIIQSSSATVGMAITLGKQNLISLLGGVAVMLGAELGTCSDTLIATIKGTRQAIKAGIFHLVFNLTTIIIGLLLFNQFVELVLYISASDSIDNQIANAHMLFNILGVIAMLPFVRLFERFLNWIIPEKETA